MKTQLQKIAGTSLMLLALTGSIHGQLAKTWDIVLDEDINGISKVDNFGFNGSFGFGYTPDSRIWKTADGGQNWTSTTIDGFSPAYPSVFELIKQVHYTDELNGVHRFQKISPPSDVYYVTTDGGNSFTYLSDTTFSAYSFTTSPDTHFATDDVWYKWRRAQRTSDSKLMDVILVTTDGGVSWSDVSDNLYNQYPTGDDWLVSSIQFISSTKGFAFGESGFYSTNDGGATWSLTNAIAGYGPIDFLDANNGYIAKHFGLFDEVQVTTDGGATFTATTLTDQVTFNTVNITEIFDVDFYDMNNGIASCSANGMPFIARTTDGGQTWIQDTIANAILSGSSAYSGFVPVQMVAPDAAFTQITVSTNRRLIIGFGEAGGNSSSITEQVQELEVQVYPNPVADGWFNIDAKETIDVAIYSLTGELVRQFSRINGLNKINVSEFKSGVYLVQLLAQDKTITKKLIID